MQYGPRNVITLGNIFMNESVTFFGNLLAVYGYEMNGRPRPVDWRDMLNAHDRLAVSPQRYVCVCVTNRKWQHADGRTGFACGCCRHALQYGHYIVVDRLIAREARQSTTECEWNENPDARTASLECLSIWPWCVCAVMICFSRPGQSNDSLKTMCLTPLQTSAGGEIYKLINMTSEKPHKHIAICPMPTVWMNGSTDRRHDQINMADMSRTIGVLENFRSWRVDEAHTTDHGNVHSHTIIEWNGMNELCKQSFAKP